MLDTPLPERSAVSVNQTLCPCERLLRSVAELYRQADEVAARADDRQYTELGFLHDQIAINEAQAARSLALSPVGAAFQALLLFQHVSFGTVDTPADLSKEERDALLAAGKGVRASGLSLYRILSRNVDDNDLAIVHRRICGSDTYADLFEQIGVDILANL